ncbi:MAG: hypothetical protein AB1512_32420 [Thermodesulfobacteriota bacterium]
MEVLTDFPKLQCPFIRRTFKVKPEDFQRHRGRYSLRQPEVYLVVDRVNPGYEWVFEDPDTFAVEKLNGTNIKLKTEKGRLVALQNRMNVIDPLQIISGKTFIIEGVFRSIGKGYVQADGEQAGELIGPDVNGNPYKLDFHEWYPFEKAITALRYKSFHEHERTFDNWSDWFRDGLFSRYYTKIASKKGTADKVFAEGVVFYNLKRRAEGKGYMAKLRRDMFDWFYRGLEIIGYDKEGRGETEDQEGFD